MWMKTLDGQDVFEQGDGWVFYGRQQQWYYEPGLLTMPEAPRGVKMQREADRLKSGWPSLHEAWSFRTNQSPNYRGVLVMKALVFWAPAYILWHIPLWIRYSRMPVLEVNTTGYANHELSVSIGLSVLALFALWIIWFDHLSAIDKHKANVVAAGVFGTVAAIEVGRRVHAFDKAMDMINHPRS